MEILPRSEHKPSPHSSGSPELLLTIPYISKTSTRPGHESWELHFPSLKLLIARSPLAVRHFSSYACSFTIIIIIIIIVGIIKGVWFPFFRAATTYFFSTLPAPVLVSHKVSSGRESPESTLRSVSLFTIRHKVKSRLGACGLVEKLRLVFAFVATGCCVYLGQTGVTESTPQFQRRKTDTRQEGKKKARGKKK